jgi:hypothetical protein
MHMRVVVARCNMFEAFKIKSLKGFGMKHKAQDASTAAMVGRLEGPCTCRGGMLPAAMAVSRCDTFMCTSLGNHSSCMQSH